MKKVMSFLMAILLSCQPSLSAASSVMGESQGQIHTIFSHDRAFEHHHHQDSSAHFESGMTEGSHQHIQDNSQTSDLVSHFAMPSVVQVNKIITILVLQIYLDIFLEGLSRPPRVLN